MPRNGSSVTGDCGSMLAGFPEISGTVTGKNNAGEKYEAG